MASKARPGSGALEGLELGLLLWRVQLQMFINQTIRSRKAGRIAGTVAGAAVILLAWSWEGFIAWLGVQASHRVPLRVDTVHLLSLAFLAYTGVLVFSSLVFSLNALLLNPDLDLLLAAPRSVESVLASRMVVQVIRLFLLSLLFTAPALILLAVANQNPLIPFAFALLFLLYPVFVVVIISLISLLLVRIIPVGRGREVLTLFGIALAIGINLANFLLNPALRDPSFGRHPGAAPALPDVPAASSAWFPSGWAGRSAAAILSGDRATAGQWLLLLLAASAAIFEDWRMRTRDLAQLVRFIMPVVFLFVIFGLRFPRLLSAVRSLGDGPPAAMIGLIPAWILLFSLSISLGLSAVSLEGKSIWVYAASPNSTLRFLQAKCWSTALPTATLVALAALAAEILIRPGWLWAVTAVVLAIAEAAAVTTLMVGIGAVFARFDWTDARRMMHPVGIFIGMGLFSIVSGASALLLVIAIALAAVTRFPLFSTWLAAMTISVGGAIAVAALSILFGNQRLRGLEVG